MQDLNEIFSKVTEALDAADKGHRILVEKVASQEAEIKTLRGRNCAEGFRVLVDKLASAGVVDDLHAVYLKDNVTDDNVNDFLGKLSDKITPKEASVSPYELSEIPISTEPTSDKGRKDLEDCNNRLLQLHGK